MEIPTTREIIPLGGPQGVQPRTAPFAGGYLTFNEHGEPIFVPVLQHGTGPSVTYPVQRIERDGGDIYVLIIPPYLQVPLAVVEPKSDPAPEGGVIGDGNAAPGQ